MRGKEDLNRIEQDIVRITPAHAGKSKLLPMQVVTGKDHPRPCGEKVQAKLYDDVQWGSPPPMRGKGRAAAIYHVPKRITPAHAGKRILPRPARAGV